MSPNKPIHLFLVLVLGWTISACPAALALDAPDERLPDPKLEKTAEDIGAQLRCPVCQNQSIEESSAGMAKTLRAQVRAQLAQGRTPQEIRRWMRAHYGGYIELSPPLNRTGLLIWISPFGIVALLGLLLLRLRGAPERRSRRG